jgi:hypothetical protein
MQVGEIAAPAARDQDLRAGLVEMVEQQHFCAALPGGQRAHQPGGSGADHDRVEILAHAPPASVSRCGDLWRPSARRTICSERLMGFPFRARVRQGPIDTRLM